MSMTYYTFESETIFTNTQNQPDISRKKKTHFIEYRLRERDNFFRK